MWDWLANKDFANYWIAAQLVLGGGIQDLFADHASYFRHMQAAFGADYPWHNWSYPPHYLLLIWPLGLIGYLPAMAVFLGLSLALYLGAARAFLGGRFGREAALLLPFVFSNLEHAQNGFLTGALFLGGLALRGHRPLAAGCLFGLLTVKPQLGLMLALLLLIEGQWRVILAGALATMALVGLSVLLFGAAPWLGYLQETLPYQSRVMMAGQGVFRAMMPSGFGGLYLLGLEGDLALRLHMLLAVPVFTLSLYGIWRSPDPQLRAVLAIVATFVVTPYWLVYDFGPFAAALIWLWRWLPRGRGLLALAALTPQLAMVSGGAGLPITPLILLLVWGLAFAQAMAARPMVAQRQP